MYAHKDKAPDVFDTEPELADCQEVKAPICTGDDLLIIVPSPNSPLPLTPQAQSVPLVFIAKQ
jgi:hypothetical protein